MKVRTRVKFKPRKLSEGIEKVKSDQVARQRVEEFLDHKVILSEPMNRGKRGIRKKSKFEQAVEDANKRAKTGEWSGATGSVFVGLYGICYKLVYGKLPIDLEVNRDFEIASNLAETTLSNYFNNDPDQFVEFIKWTWEREMNRVQYSFKKGFTKNRLIARFQFSRSYAEDYRVFLSTKNRYGRNN